MAKVEDTVANDLVKSDSVPAHPDAGVVVAALAGLAGLAAAWLAAGSTGLLAHPLRHALTWVTLGAAAVAGWPGFTGCDPNPLAWAKRFQIRAAVLLAGLVAAVAMSASDSPPVNALAAPLVLGLLAGLWVGEARRLLGLAAGATAVLAVYRLALASSPAAWLAADALGEALGRLGGLLAGKELSVGATFAGLDYLVLMGALYAFWLAFSPPRRLTRAVAAAAFILAGHAVYLAVLARATDLLAALPLPPERSPTALPWNQEPWSFSGTLRATLPWNLPALAALIHLTVAAFMLRSPLAPEPPPEAPFADWRRWRRPAAWAAALLAAGILPVVSGLSRGQASLHGKTIVAYEKGFLNWLKPEHGPNASDYGHFSVGMYGMLPIYTETLGGRFRLSGELSQKDLAGADVLMMMYPNTAWTGEQLQRIHAFVRQGGSLLIFGEHTIRQSDGRNRFNDLLELFAADSADVPEPLVRMADLNWSWEQREKHLTDLRNGMLPADAAGDLTAAGKARAAKLLADLGKQFGDVGLTVNDLGQPGKEGLLQRLAARVHRSSAQAAAMQIPFDSALFQVGGWLQSYDALAHPATSGLRDDRNQFGAVIGASVKVRPPARPVLVGRYGWAEPGDAGSAEAMMRDRRFTPGERLGDVVLAAEQRAGKGRVFAFGDTSTITNGINLSSHAFTSRLLTYLADPGAVGNPQGPWRQGLGLLAAGVLIASLAWRGHPWRTAAASVVLAASITLCAGASYRSALTLPDGREHKIAGKPANNLAYIDTSHLELASNEAWRDDGTMGLCLTLMRNGYETLLLPPEKLGPAGRLFNRDLFGERLARAGVFISLAPTRAFTGSERKALRDYVENGGIFILTVGYPESAPSRGVLEDFGFSLDSEPGGKAPQAMGHFKAPYVENGPYMAHVRFHAAWPVRGTGDGFQPIANGPGEKPVILMRTVGKGKVVVIGDTCFAMNKNLEREDGQPFEGMRENADFWRWFLPYLTGRPAWLPSPPGASPAPAPAAPEAAAPEPAATEPPATEPAETEPAASQPAASDTEAPQ